MPFDEETERRLLDNDPTLTSLDLQSTQEGNMSWARLAVALNCSMHVRHLFLSFHLFDDICSQYLNGDISSPHSKETGAVALWISKSSSLTRLCFSPSSRKPETTFHLLPIFLDAVRLRTKEGRPSLKHLVLWHLQFDADDMLTLLQNCSVNRLHLHTCFIDKGSFATDDFAVQAVAQSFATNKTLLGLDVDFEHEDDCIAYYAAIIAAMQKNTSLKQLKIGRHEEHPSEATTIPVAVADAMVSLLRSSICPLQKLGLRRFAWTDGSFARIAQGIQTSPMKIQELFTSRCCFDETSGRHFRSIFTSAGCTTTRLVLKRIIVLPSPSGDKSMLSVLLLSRHSRLRELRICNFDHSETENEQFQAILQGLATASCQIRRLELGSTIADAPFDALLNALPKFQHLRCISFTMKSAPQWKAKVLSAFRSNFSLVQSNLLQDHDWSTKDRSILITYHERNQNLGRALWSESKAKKFGNGGALLPSLLYVAMIGNGLKGVSRAFGTLYLVDDHVGPISCSAKRTLPLDE
jgi:hypothetical protein